MSKKVSKNGVGIIPEGKNRHAINYPEKAEDINMISQTLDIKDIPDTRWTLYIYFESKGKYYVWKRWVDRVDYQIVDAKDNISLEEYKYGKLFELCIECNVDKIFNHIENDLGLCSR